MRVNWRSLSLLRAHFRLDRNLAHLVVHRAVCSVYVKHQVLNCLLHQGCKLCFANAAGAQALLRNTAFPLVRVGRVLHTLRILQRKHQSQLQFTSVNRCLLFQAIAYADCKSNVWMMFSAISVNTLCTVWRWCCSVTLWGHTMLSIHSMLLHCSWLPAPA